LRAIYADLTFNDVVDVTQWLTSDIADLRNLLGDICCFILLTPLTVISMWLCISGAVHYSTSPLYGPAGWETIGLLSLSVFLLVVYCLWCLVRSLFLGVLWNDVFTGVFRGAGNYVFFANY